MLSNQEVAMFGLSPIELIIVDVVGCFVVALPITIIVLLIRLVAIKEKKDQPPRRCNQFALAATGPKCRSLVAAIAIETSG
jgi:hypothetical protein